jgi:hypothetical protein
MRFHNAYKFTSSQIQYIIMLMRLRLRDGMGYDMTPWFQFVKIKLKAYTLVIHTVLYNREKFKHL